jgi:hypothetical protein
VVLLLAVACSTALPADQDGLQEGNVDPPHPRSRCLNDNILIISFNAKEKEIENKLELLAGGLCGDS